MEETPLSGLWKNRTGSYRIEGANKEYQMFSDFSLDIVNGVVVMKGKLNLELGPPYFTIPLRIVADDLAVVYGYGRFCGSAVQFSQKPGEKEVMSYMGFSCVKAE